MKTITVNVSEPVYREFREYARKQDRNASELIREAMELYRDQKMALSGAGVEDIPPVSVGKILRPLTSEDDLLDEMSSA